MVIDFIGSPGAGKSTVVPITIDTLRKAGINALPAADAARQSIRSMPLGRIAGKVTPPRYQDAVLWHVFYRLSMAYRIKFALRHYQLYQFILNSQRNRPKESEVARRRIIPKFLSLMGIYEYLQYHSLNNQAVLFDEGFIHRVVQLTTSDMEKADPPMIEKYLSLLPKPDLIVYVNVPAAVCLERVFTRGVWGHYLHKSPEQVARFVYNAHEGVEMAVNQIKEWGWPLIEINNTLPLIKTEIDLNHQIADVIHALSVHPEVSQSSP